MSNTSVIILAFLKKECVFNKVDLAIKSNNIVMEVKRKENCHLPYAQKSVRGSLGTL